MPLSDDWNAAAVPWKLVLMVAGRVSRASRPDAARPPRPAKRRAAG